MKLIFLPQVSVWIISLFLGFCIKNQINAQSSAQPTINGNFTNTKSFNFSTRLFDFKYTGIDGNLTYRYNPALGGSFKAVECIADGNFSFAPSNMGGIVMINSANQEVFPWSSGVTYQLLSINAVQDTLDAYWKMSSGTNSIHYHLKLHINGRTLVIKIIADTPNAASVTTDRSERTPDPTVIPIPYLPYMNALHTKGYFASMFFDWDKTDASGIYPLDNIFSTQSAYYGQVAYYLYDNKYNRSKVNETLYLTVSKNVEDILPNIPNTVSPKKSVSADKIVLDLWTWGFNNVKNNIETCGKAGIKNLWVIQHFWQNGGYDNKYPDVLPANTDMGGNMGIMSVKQTADKYNYLYALHENYADIYPNAPSWSPYKAALEQDGSWRKAWFNTYTNTQSYVFKHKLADQAAVYWGNRIHNTFNTNASFIDVHSAAHPASFNDYDANEPNSKKQRTTMDMYRQMGKRMREAHLGPVSGEGNYHFMYAGYYDDFEAQINCGKYDWGKYQGVRLPLFANFKLNKLHKLVAQHGVGYYERFFSAANGSPQFSAFSKNDVLTYIATELAYGNCGFIPTYDRVSNFLETSNLEFKHVYSAQRQFANAQPISILYNLNGSFVTASQFISAKPKTFSEYNSPDFMAQVKVEYNNGTVVYVNRHPTKTWTVKAGELGGWCNYHALIGGKSTLFVGTTQTTTYTLPVNNGFVITRKTPFLKEEEPNITEFLQNKSIDDISISPNPVSDKLMIHYDNIIVKDIELVDYLGRVISHITNVDENGTQLSVNHLPNGTYLVRCITDKGDIITQKVIVAH